MHMREPNAWIESDILDLVNERAEESLTLEFKACDALRNKRWREEFAKDVSAFANSAGGIIIYGLREDPQTHEAGEIDDGYDPTEIDKQTLQRIIDTRVHRRIEGIKYNTIHLATMRPGKVLFVVDVPESPLAPHMADHRFFKRLEYESKPMEEYEIRERYRRETFPGKDVVEAWRDDAINPLITQLSAERQLLKNEQWTWNRYDLAFRGFAKLARDLNQSANREDFLTRHSDVSALLKEHDDDLAALNNQGKVLYERAAASPFFKEMFDRATCDYELLKLKSEAPNYFQTSTSPELLIEIFGRDLNENERRQSFAEWAINSKTETNIELLLLFWRVNGDRFRKGIVHSDNYPPVLKARESLLTTIESILSLLKDIRTDLSERHNIPHEARQATVPTYNDPFRIG
jgi:hypothetical protein